MYRHIQNHEEENAFACDDCSLKFSSEVKLTRHFEMAHAEKLCEFCDFKLSGEAGLKKHITAAHRDRIKNFLCEKCDFRTDSNQNLTAHIKHMHTKRPKFLCNICNQILSDKRGLQIHIGKKSSTRFFIWLSVN